MSSDEFKSRMHQIGTSVHVRGDVQCDHDLVVNGHVEGNVSAVTQEIVVGGQIAGDLRARVVLISGRVHGDVHASERITLQPGCRVEGDLVAPRIVLHEGALLSGAVRMPTPALRAASCEPARRATRRPRPSLSKHAGDEVRPTLSALPFR